MGLYSWPIGDNFADAFPDYRAFEEGGISSNKEVELLNFPEISECNLLPYTAVPAENGDNSLIANEKDGKSLQTLISEPTDVEGVIEKAKTAVPYAHFGENSFPAQDYLEYSDSSSKTLLESENNSISIDSSLSTKKLEVPGRSRFSKPSQEITSSFRPSYPYPSPSEVVLRLQSSSW